MSSSRRHFLKFLTLGAVSSQPALLSGCTHQKFFNPDQEILLGAARFKKGGELKHVLAVVNHQLKAKELVELDFLAHGIIVDPKNKKRLIAIEKNAGGAVEVNLDTLTVSNTITISDERQFNGHGVFNKKGDTFYCTETSVKSNEGHITVRDAKSFELIDEFSSYGENPHDCQLIDNGTTLVVTNTGSDNIATSQPNVVYIDVVTKKLRERIMLSDKTLNAGHVGISKAGDLILASAPRKSADPETTNAGGVSIRSGKRSMLRMTQPEMVIDKLTGEALSISIDEKHDIAAITHPEANLITFWSIEKRELIKAMSVPDPRGITLSINGDAYIVSYDTNPSLVFINTKSLTARTDSIMQPSFISGEHVYNWSRIIREIMPTDVYT